MWSEDYIEDINCPNVKIEQCDASGYPGEKYNDGLCWMTNNYQTSIFGNSPSCPNGWYVPSKEQFDSLVSDSQAGGGTCLWSRGWNGGEVFWSSTKINQSASYALSVSISGASVGGYSWGNGDVRCVSY